MVKLLEFVDRHAARHLFRSSHLNISYQNKGAGPRAPPLDPSLLKLIMGLKYYSEQ